MTHLIRRETTQLGVFSPIDHLVAIVADLGEAEQALQALHQAGFDEVYLYQGPQVLQDYATFKAQRSLLQRFEAVWRSDEELIVREYLYAARQGHHLIMVHAPQCAEARRAGAILEQYHAYGIRHYGHWTIHETHGHMCTVNLKAMLELDLEHTLQDVAKYKWQAQQAEELGAYDIKASLEKIAAQEAAHTDELQRLLRGL